MLPLTTPNHELNCVSRLLCLLYNLIAALSSCSGLSFLVENKFLEHSYIFLKPSKVPGLYDGQETGQDE